MRHDVSVRWHSLHLGGRVVLFNTTLSGILFLAWPGLQSGGNMTSDATQ